MKDKITKLLIDKLDSVYCHTCKHYDSDVCDDCTRKSMMWAISKSYANKIAENINNIIIEHKEK